jgi:hypothetical protein
MTDIQQIRPQTTDEQLKELFSRTAKLNDAMSALLDPRWGANVGILPKDHPLYPKALEPLPSAFGHKVSKQEQAAPVDWQAVVQRRERELKEVGEARHRAEAAIARVRQLAAEQQTEGTNGEPCDADTLWPSEILAALDQRKEG